MKKISDTEVLVNGIVDPWIERLKQVITNMRPMRRKMRAAIRASKSKGKIKP